MPQDLALSTLMLLMIELSGIDEALLRVVLPTQNGEMTKLRLWRRSTIVRHRVDVAINGMERLHDSVDD